MVNQIQRHHLSSHLGKINSFTLILALFSILLYLSELFGMFPESPGITSFLNWTNLVIDGIFCIDLLLKWTISGKSYRKSIWFWVDLVSCLPIISSLMEVLSNTYNFGLEGSRAVRGARLTNIVRASRMTKVSRILKSLRLARGVNVFKTQHFEPDEMPNFETALKITIPILIASFLVISCYFEFFFQCTKYK